MATSSKVFTKTLDTESFTYLRTMGLTRLSIQCISGTVTVLGNLILQGGIQSDAIQLPVGGGVSYGNTSSSELDDIVIDATAGVAILTGE